MNKTLKCPICGAEFETTKKKKKYCSFSCREAGRKLQRIKWEGGNPSYNTDYQRKRRAALKDGANTCQDTLDNGEIANVSKKQPP